MEGITRRRMLEAIGVAGAGVVLGGDAIAALAPIHQPGIATPAPQHLLFAAFDVTATSRAELRDLMRAWSAAAAAERGSRLTTTFGFGPGLFDHGRYGLDAARPQALEPLPAFPGDALDPARSGGDIAVQACAGDPGAAQRAVQRLAARASGVASLRWERAGFVHNAGKRTPRNLMGFKDGTNNIAGDRAAMSYDVWVRSPGWMRGGTYLVVRQIRMKLDQWNATPVQRQERVIGRHKKSGAPLGGHHEFDRVDLTAGVARGDPVIPTDAHIRLASPHANGGVRILRRSYNSSDGLVFICFQRHPRQFAAIQQRLGERDDALGNFIVPEGSAVFACPPAARRGGFVGDRLL